MSRLVARPLTADRWPDLERLFGASGAYANCWCTFQIQSGKEFSAGCRDRGAGNRALLRRLTTEGHGPGLIGYRHGRPVGWISVGPRTMFGRMLRSPVTRLDRGARQDASVWAIVCLWMPRAERGLGTGRALVDAAVAYARRSGAMRVEGYPVDTAGRRVHAAEIFTGTVDLFAGAGFELVAEHWRGRPVMSRALARAG